MKPFYTEICAKKVNSRIKYIKGTDQQFNKQSTFYYTKIKINNKNSDSRLNKKYFKFTLQIQKKKTIHEKMILFQFHLTHKNQYRSYSIFVFYYCDKNIVNLLLDC